VLYWKWHFGNGWWLNTAFTIHPMTAQSTQQRLGCKLQYPQTVHLTTP